MIFWSDHKSVSTSHHCSSLWVADFRIFVMPYRLWLKSEKTAPRGIQFTLNAQLIFSLSLPLVVFFFLFATSSILRDNWIEPFPLLHYLRSFWSPPLMKGRNRQENHSNSHVAKHLRTESVHVVVVDQVFHEKKILVTLQSENYVCKLWLNPYNEWLNSLIRSHRKKSAKIMTCDAI